MACPIESLLKHTEQSPEVGATAQHFGAPSRILIHAIAQEIVIVTALFVPPPSEHHPEGHGEPRLLPAISPNAPQAPGASRTPPSWCFLRHPC